MSHFIMICKVCNVVMAQCRCSGNKDMVWSVCKECSKPPENICKNEIDNGHAVEDKS